MSGELLLLSVASRRGKGDGTRGLVALRRELKFTVTIRPMSRSRVKSRRVASFNLTLNLAGFTKQFACSFFTTLFSFSRHRLSQRGYRTNYCCCISSAEVHFRATRSAAAVLEAVRKHEEFFRDVMSMDEVKFTIIV